MNHKSPRRYFVDIDGLPARFPTHKHDAGFWESLGRVVATFGFLEEILGRAIFAFSATRPYTENEVEEAYSKWLSRLEHALTDSLGNLIDVYGRSVREHPQAHVVDLADLLGKLREASQMRNVLCHASWRLPGDSGASIPLYVHHRKGIFSTAVDQGFLDQVQRHTAELACAIVSTVTQMGWQFPGSTGPGEAVWK